MRLNLRKYLIPDSFSWAFAIGGTAIPLILAVIVVSVFAPSGFNSLNRHTTIFQCPEHKNYIAYDQQNCPVCSTSMVLIYKGAPYKNNFQQFLFKNTLIGNSTPMNKQTRPHDTSTCESIFCGKDTGFKLPVNARPQAAPSGQLP